MDAFAKTFWSESFWLTPGLSWNDLQNKPDSGIYIAQARDMLLSIPLALVIIMLRFLFERFLVTPLAEMVGVKDRKMPVIEPNTVLEELYLQNGTTSNNNLESVAKKTDLSVRQVERWLRDRQLISKSGKMKKFKECSWLFVFYLSSFVCGLYVHWDKPWFWDTAYCWKNWPKLHVSTDLYIYYLVELSFYLSLVFTLLSDHKRKDFKEMVIHHVATILLIFFSWSVNFTRIGSLVILCHDAADFPLAFGKLTKYYGAKTVCNIVFGIFLVTWIVSRLIYYPRVILYSTVYELYELIDAPLSVRYFNMLLILLQILHLIWTYMIAKVVLQMFTKGKLDDVRSESESD